MKSTPVKNIISDYISASSGLLNFFDCEQDYFIKPMVNMKWAVKQDEDMYFLSYWNDESNITTAVIIKKEGKPHITSRAGFTMIVAVDCIKIAFVFKNNNNAE